ncbi:MAG TPA: toast rack family protein, partial [Atribacterota bacterium]|nr:toast rack family protein [Atribacterota bacterium]
MNKKNATLSLFILLISFLIFALTGCWSTGEHTEETVNVELEEAEKVNATIVIYKGDLCISGENQELLLISDFDYNLNQWAPQVTYSTEKNEGKLKIIQKEKEKGLFNPFENKWSLIFNQTVPLELDIVMGNGEYHLDLSSIHLIDLKAAIGTGDTNLDLMGNYQENINVYLIGGIGHTTINLAEDTGVRLWIK